MRFRSVSLMIQLTITSLAVMTNSCTKSEDSAESEVDSSTVRSTFFLNAKDLKKPASVTVEVERYELNDALSNEGFVYNTQPNGEVDCISDVLNSMVVTGNADILSYGVDAKFPNCFKTILEKQDSELTYNVSKADLRYYVEYACEGGDFEKYDGKTIEELDGFDANPNFDLDCTNETYKAHLSMDIEAAFAHQGGSGTIKMYSVNFDGGGDFGVATKTTVNNVANYEDGYQSVYLSDMDVMSGEETENTKSYENFITENVTASKGETWYSSGSIIFDMDSWVGSIVYTDGNTAPDYAASKGSETDSGTLDESQYSLVDNKLQLQNIVGLKSGRAKTFVAKLLSQLNLPNRRLDGR